jgi:hypothetical protein
MITNCENMIKILLRTEKKQRKNKLALRVRFPVLFSYQRACVDLLHSPESASIQKDFLIGYSQAHYEINLKRDVKI